MIISSSELLRVNSVEISRMITDILWNVTQALHAKGIISFEVKDQILTATGEGDNKKAIYLLHVLQRQLGVHSDPDQYLVNICNVLINQQQQTLTDIATSILQQLGQFVLLLLIYSLIFHISGQTISDQPTYSGTPDQPTYYSTPDHSDTLTSCFERLQRPFKRSHSTPDRPTYSGTPDQPTYYYSTPDQSDTLTSCFERLQRPFKRSRSTPDQPTYSSTLDPSVQQYCQIIKEKYTHQPVVTTDWPPPVGKNFFGKLMLLEPQQQMMMK